MALLEVSQATYREIKRKLDAAGYADATDADGIIDLHGIGLAPRPKSVPPRNNLPSPRRFYPPHSERDE